MIVSHACQKCCPAVFISHTCSSFYLFYKPYVGSLTHLATVVMLFNFGLLILMSALSTVSGMYKTRLYETG